MRMEHYSKEEVNNYIKDAKSGDYNHLLATSIDGIYDSDLAVNPDAKRYDKISITEVIDKRLAVMDLSASIMCMENSMPMYVFLLNEEDSIEKAISGSFNGTIVTV